MILCINWVSPEIIAVIINGGCTLVVAMGTVLFFRKKKAIELEFENKGKEIQYKLNTQLEVIKLQLSSLQERRVDAINDVYTELVNVLEFIESGLIFSQDNEKAKADFIKSAGDLKRFWTKYKLFFPEKLAHDIDIFINKAYHSSHGYFLFLNSDPIDWKQIGVIRDEASKEMRPLLNEIEKSVRKLIGVENETKR